MLVCVVEQAEVGEEASESGVMAAVLAAVAVPVAAAVAAVSPPSLEEEDRSPSPAEAAESAPEDQQVRSLLQHCSYTSNPINTGQGSKGSKDTASNREPFS